MSKSAPVARLPSHVAFHATRGVAPITPDASWIVVNRLFSLLVALIPAGAAIAQTGRAGGPTTDVPVKKVVLFSSGVGYFEHGGSVRGNGSTELRFKTSQINDI